MPKTIVIEDKDLDFTVGALQKALYTFDSYLEFLEYDNVTPSPKSFEQRNFIAKLIYQLKS